MNKKNKNTAKKEKNQDPFFDLIKRTGQLSARHQAIESAIFYLKRKYDEDLAEMLREYSYVLTKENLQEDLKVVQEKNNLLHMDLQKLTKEVDKVDQKNQEIIREFLRKNQN